VGAPNGGDTYFTSSTGTASRFSVVKLGNLVPAVVSYWQLRHHFAGDPRRLADDVWTRRWIHRCCYSELRSVCRTDARKWAIMMMVIGPPDQG
jgi:hypothetical protein